jgi:hypothetical protein
MAVMIVVPPKKVICFAEEYFLSGLFSTDMRQFTVRPRLEREDRELAAASPDRAELFSPPADAALELRHQPNQRNAACLFSSSAISSPPQWWIRGL